MLDHGRTAGTVTCPGLAPLQTMPIRLFSPSEAARLPQITKEADEIAILVA